MSDFDYDFLLSFIDVYDANVIQSSAVPHNNSDDFKQFISDKVSELLLVLSLQPGVKTISRYVEYETIKYCINLKKTQ